MLVQTDIDGVVTTTTGALKATVFSIVRSKPQSRRKKIGKLILCAELGSFLCGTLFATAQKIAMDLRSHESVHQESIQCQKYVELVQHLYLAAYARRANSVLYGVS